MDFDIAHAWKNAKYRQSLTPQQRAMLPENPVGSLELTEADLEAIQGQGLGHEAFGSNNPFGDCAISFGAQESSTVCNTYGKYILNCYSNTSS